MTLDAPICRFGYPHSQLVELLEEDQLKTFFRWMIGQTFTECDGRLYNYETKRMEPSGCGPHGFVYYEWDVQRFLAGLSVID